MFSADFVIDGIVVFAIGLWPLLLVIAAAGVRWFNARRTTAATAVASVATAHGSLMDFAVDVHPAEQRFRADLDALSDPWAWSRTPTLARLHEAARSQGLRFAHGPDEVHKHAVAKSHIGRQLTAHQASSPAEEQISA
ncbi:hypothetical protein [Mycobacterium sp. 360MFTsu5.1]|uniref:hypothetical protein n=1 Tax=Mycobacterium sp. 360MFTsu5.1 TaxID=1172186 RepID=UPI000382B6E8|nr:hypothetical protein [Mycobacterium sp. 360MFTsu5.1]